MDASGVQVTDTCVDAMSDITATGRIAPPQNRRESVCKGSRGEEEGKYDPDRQLYSRGKDDGGYLGKADLEGGSRGGEGGGGPTSTQKVRVGRVHGSLRRTLSSGNLWHTVSSPRPRARSADGTC